MLTRHQAKRLLKKRGWSWRAAAPVLGTTFRHLAYVLAGDRKSDRILAAISQLPSFEEWKRTHEAQG